MLDVHVLEFLTVCTLETLKNKSLHFDSSNY